MRFIIIPLCFFSAVAFSQTSKPAKVDTLSNMYDYGARYYSPNLCGDCERYRDTKHQPKKYMNSPYQYSKPTNPIVLPDSIFNELLKNQFVINVDSTKRKIYPIVF